MVKRIRRVDEEKMKNPAKKTGKKNGRESHKKKIIKPELGKRPYYWEIR